MKRVINLIIYSILCCIAGVSQNKVLTLDECRTMAISNNKTLKMSDQEKRAAYYERKAAFTKYLPKISATGMYMHTGREISLLNGEQKETLGSLGSNISVIAPELEKMESALNGIGSNLVEALHTDTRNTGALCVMLTQPVYMGGKICAYNKITHYAERIAERNHDLALQDVIVDVDEAYWQIVSLSFKKSLAESYLKMVEKLDDDIQKMIEQGVATKADGLSVKVKVNEAHVTLIQVDNGLSLSKMLLCQICGLEITDDFTVADENVEVLIDPQPVTTDVYTALQNRPELAMLNYSEKIYQEKVKIARAEFLPTVALTGGYIASNPSVFNSFERQFKGMWSIGVAVNIPIVTFGERFYKVRAAKAQAELTALKFDETREKIILQVNQNMQKVEEANERLLTAKRSVNEADENLRYATLGLKEGVIPVINVLEAQTAWLKAHSTHVSSQIDLRLANLYLLKSTGLMNH